MANQANRRSLTMRFRLDPQWARNAVFKYGCDSVQCMCQKDLLNRKEMDRAKNPKRQDF